MVRSHVHLARFHANLAVHGGFAAAVACVDGFLPTIYSGRTEIRRLSFLNKVGSCVEAVGSVPAKFSCSRHSTTQASSIQLAWIFSSHFNKAFGALGPLSTILAAPRFHSDVRELS